MKLELGSGERPTPGFVHLDRRVVPDLQLWGDVEDLYAALRVTGYNGPLPRETQYEEIRATHLLEHISHLHTVRVLKHWRGFLEPRGQLYVEVPNLTGHVDAWKAGRNSDKDFVLGLFGGQDYDLNHHKTMFTEATLHNALRAAGYRDVSVTDIGLVLNAGATSPA